MLMLGCCFSENGIELLKVKATSRPTTECWLAQDRESSTIIAINFQEFHGNMNFRNEHEAKQTNNPLIKLEIQASNINQQRGKFIVNVQNQNVSFNLR